MPLVIVFSDFKLFVITMSYPHLGVWFTPQRQLPKKKWAHLAIIKRVFLIKRLKKNLTEL